jgi:hypothetical protein
MIVRENFIEKSGFSKARESDDQTYKEKEWTLGIKKMKLKIKVETELRFWQTKNVNNW